MGECLTVHPPDVVRRMTLSQARALLRAVHRERQRQVDLQVETLTALAGHAGA